MANRDHVIKRMILDTMEHCSVCGRQLTESDLRVLGHQEDMWFLIVICHNCRTQGLLAVTVKEQTVSRPVTDLTEEERPRFAQAGPVTPDDVLDLHEFLKRHEGDVVSLFRKET